MKHYKVIWEIDLTAESPREAAEQAYEIQRDRDSTASVFDVYDARGKKTRIDLSEPYKARRKRRS